MLSCRDKRHDIANQYFKYWVEHGVLMYISSIVLSELLAKAESLPTEIARHVRVLPYTVEDAQKAGILWRSRGGDRLDNQNKTLFKDDIKIIGHAIRIRSWGLAHGDIKTMHKYICDAISNNLCPKNFRSILISDGFDECLASLPEGIYPQPSLPGFSAGI